MPSSKDRLYIALYARSGASKMPGGEDKYHWSFIVAPKNESPDVTGRRCHAKEKMEVVDGIVQNVWAFEDRQISLHPTSAILVRILIGKDFKETKGGIVFFWIEEALSLAACDGKALGGKSHTDWKFVKDTAMWYVKKKADEHRFDGTGEFDQSKVPTWDALEGKEVNA